MLFEILQYIAQNLDYFSDLRAPYDDDGGDHSSGLRVRRLNNLRDLIENPLLKISDLPSYTDAVKNANGTGLDDRKLLLENVLVLMSRLEKYDRELSNKLQKLVITLLYDDLPHPPRSYIRTPQYASPLAITSSETAKYPFRSADGSNYNPLFPSMGKAGTPYARSVPSARSIPRHLLPDAGLVFDTLLRREKFTEHPAGVSSLFFAFANLVIHSIFNTNHTDGAINNTSSYLDLSILYGNSQREQDTVRRRDGSGKLWNDVFADGRLLYMPPASCALLVLFSRNHNYVAQKLLDINEKGTFVNPLPADPKVRAAQDDEIFHRARLINCGFFMQIILGDYVGAILGLVRDKSSWRLNPLMAIRGSNHKITPCGEGNVVSVEFNLLYRWHSTLSDQDTKWTTSLFERVLENKEPSKATVDDFRRAAHNHLIPPEDVRTWKFNGLERDSNGYFNDDDLAKLIQDSTEHRAGAFQARGIPEALRIVEILGIEQAREWGTCSLNEFRKFLGLKPYKNFKEWNPDEKIHTAAAALYKDIDNLELHVGLQAEETKAPGPGAGLCPGYTISRAILADAVALSRGDPYLTTELTPFNLTSWGYDDCQYDTEDGSYGGLLTKLLFRTLPRHYPAGSAYAHFPFLDPSFMEKTLANDPDLLNKYTWTRPGLPLPTVPVDNYLGVKQVLTAPDFMSAYDDRIFTVVKGALMKAGHSVAEKEELAANKHSPPYLIKGRISVQNLLPVSGDKSWAEYFKKKTLELIQEKSFRRVGSNAQYVDIVHDVINLLPIHWVSQEIMGLPLKTETREGAWYEQDVYKMFADVGRYVFLNFDPADDWHHREDAIEAFNKVTQILELSFGSMKSFFSLSYFRGNKGNQQFLEQVLALYKNSSRTVDSNELSAYVFAAVIPTIAHFSQAIAHVVNFYLDEDKRQQRADIVRLATLQDDKSVERIMGYIREALRIDPPVSGVYRTAGKDIQTRYVSAKAGQRVFVSIEKANLDVTEFGPTPETASYDRPIEKSGIMGLGDYGLLSPKFFNSTVPTIVGTILGLKNLERSPGASGEFASFTEEWHGYYRQLYINSENQITPFPDSLTVKFE